MYKEKEKIIRILDFLILGFLLLFAATLTNALFFNQLGYYGALIFIIAKFFYTGENPFSKTGLELPFIAFIIVEIISALLSYNQALAFENTFKRAVLLPTVYTVAAGITDMKKAKILFWCFISFVVISSLIYLYGAYQFYISGMLSRIANGPTIFQITLTTSELFSFAVIILFAFFINAKNTTKVRIITAIAFVITAAAMVATYKRTGWIAAAGGIFIVTLISRRWFILAFFILAAALIVLQESDMSRIYVYKQSESGYTKLYSFETRGYSYDLEIEEDRIISTNYQAGINLYYSRDSIYHIKTPEPAVYIDRVDSTHLLFYYLDTRFVVFKENENGLLKQVSEFASRGNTENYELHNKRLYVIDKDAGLTVFNNLFDPSDTVLIERLKGYSGVSLSENYISLFTDNNDIALFRLNKGLPGTDIPVKYDRNKYSIIDKIGEKEGRIYFMFRNVIGYLDSAETAMRFIDNDKLRNLYSCIKNDSSTFLLSSTGVISQITLDAEKGIELSQQFNLGYFPLALTFHQNKLYTSRVQRGRLHSIVDLNYSSNRFRLVMWRAAFRIFADHPFFGVGDIGTEHLHKKYSGKYEKIYRGHFHSNYFHLLVILGGIGFIVVMWIFVKMYIIKAKIYKKTKHTGFSGSFALGAIGALTGFMISGLTEWSFGDHEIITMVWFIMGLDIAIGKLTNKSETDQ